jgi:hypothetical protein
MNDADTSTTDGEQTLKHTQYKAGRTSLNNEPHGTWVGVHGDPTLVAALTNGELVGALQEGLAVVGLSLADVDRFDVAADGPLAARGSDDSGLSDKVTMKLDLDPEATLHPSDAPRTVARESLVDGTVSKRVVLCSSGDDAELPGAVKPTDDWLVSDDVAIVAIAPDEASSA